MAVVLSATRRCISIYRRMICKYRQPWKLESGLKAVRPLHCPCGTRGALTDSDIFAPVVPRPGLSDLVVPLSPPYLFSLAAISKERCEFDQQVWAVFDPHRRASLTLSGCSLNRTICGQRDLLRCNAEIPWCYCVIFLNGDFCPC